MENEKPLSGSQLPKKKFCRIQTANSQRLWNALQEILPEDSSGLPNTGHDFQQLETRNVSQIKDTENRRLWNALQEVLHTENSEIPTIVEVPEKERLEEAKKIIEALLFAANEPLPIQKLRDILSLFSPFPISVVRELLRELEQFYHSSNSPFQLHEIAGGYLLRTRETYRPYIEKLYGVKRTEKLSQAAMEVLAIIAYRQPIARAQIEGIRGVDCSNSLHSLMERELVAQVGRSETPGRPPLYGTTSGFLKHFGLSSLDQLPKFISGLQSCK